MVAVNWIEICTRKSRATVGRLQKYKIYITIVLFGN